MKYVCMSNVSLLVARYFFFFYIPTPIYIIFNYYYFVIFLVVIVLLFQLLFSSLILSKFNNTIYNNFTKVQWARIENLVLIINVIRATVNVDVVIQIIVRILADIDTVVVIQIIVDGHVDRSRFDLLQSTVGLDEIVVVGSERRMYRRCDRFRKWSILRQLQFRNILRHLVSNGFQVLQRTLTWSLNLTLQMIVKI